MKTLDFIADLYGLNLNARSPIEIPNMGRNDLAGLFARLDFRLGAEIGVEQGVFSEVLCQANPQATLYCVDPWRAYKGYRDHVSQEKLDRFYAITQDRLAPYSVELMRMTSEYASAEFDDNSLDFVYIDGNHELPYVINDMIWWSAKVKKGGILAGHDYYESTRVYTKCHVKYAVDCFMRSYRVQPWFLCGLKAKLPGLTRDKERSWFMVKQ